MLALPVVALGGYGMAASGAGLAVLLYVKVAENGTDYSVMNTAKQMIWLPTSREEKYKAKQAIDTFFVRAGDMLAAGVVFVGTYLIPRGVAGFARLNVLLVLVAIGSAWLVLREYRRLTAPEGAGGRVKAWRPADALPRAGPASPTAGPMLMRRSWKTLSAESIRMSPNRG